MMKKETQQPRVKTGLCVRRYLGNSSEMEVTMVSMVANCSDAGEGTPEAPPSPKGSAKVLCVSHQAKWYLYEDRSLGLLSLDESKGSCWGPTHKVSKGNLSRMSNLELCLQPPEIALTSIHYDTFSFTVYS